MKLLKRVLAVLCAIMMVVDLCLASCLTVYAREYYRAEDMIAEDSQPEMAALNVEETVPASEEIATQPAETPAADTEQTEMPTDSSEPASKAVDAETITESVSTKAETDIFEAETTLKDSEEVSESESEEALGVQTVEQKLSYEDANVIIHISPITANAVPENASLKVIPVVRRTAGAGMSAEQTAEIETVNKKYLEVEQKLNRKLTTKENYVNAGFLSYDVSLVDPQGNLVELNGPARLTMEYKTSMLPEGTDNLTKRAEVTMMRIDNVNAERNMIDMSETGELKELTVTEQKQVQRAVYETGKLTTYTLTWTDKPAVANTLTFKGSDYTVTTTYDETSDFPGDTELVVSEIEPGTEEYESYYQQTLEALQAQGNMAGVSSARFFDISFMVDGEKIEPAASVDVKITYDESIDGEGKTGNVVHFAETGTEVLEPELAGEGKRVDSFEFTQDSFSVSGMVLANDNYYKEIKFEKIGDKKTVNFSNNFVTEYSDYDASIVNVTKQSNSVVLEAAGYGETVVTVTCNSKGNGKGQSSTYKIQVTVGSDTTLTASGSGYSVKVTGNLKSIPGAEKLIVEDFAPGADGYEQYYTALAEDLNGIGKDVSLNSADAGKEFDFLKMYHIYLADASGKEVEVPDGTNVNLRAEITYNTMPEGLGDKVYVGHYKMADTGVSRKTLSVDGASYSTGVKKVQVKNNSVVFHIQDFSVMPLAVLADESNTETGGDSPIVQGSILTQEMLQYNNLPTSNHWQIVDNGYKGNTSADKTLSSDGNVRVQKNVIATDIENEFLVYLSIDTKQMFEEYFRIAEYQATPSNNYHDKQPGEVVDSMTGSVDVDVTGDSNRNYKKSALFTIKDSKGHILAENVMLYWSHGDNATFCLRLSNGKWVLLGLSVKAGGHNTVQLSEEAEEYIREEVTKAAQLQNVIDTMGEYIEFLGVENSDGAAIWNEGAQQLTWTPEVKTKPATEEETIESGNDKTTIIWNLNVAELVYKVRLNVEKEGFNSCANNMNSGLEDSETYAVNQSAVLTYNDGKSVEFPVPHVRGLLYEFNFHKVDSEDDSTKLPGAEFTLTSENGKAYKAIDLGDGKYTFKDIPWGNYTMEETNPPSGYQLGETREWAVTVGYTLDLQDGTIAIDKHIHESPSPYYRWIGHYDINDQLQYDANAEWKILNEKIKNQILFKKVSSTNENFVLKDAKFELYDSERNLLATLTSDDNGYFSLANNNFTNGTYYLKEIKAPSGYSLLADEIEFTVSDGSVTVTGNSMASVNSATEGDKTVYTIVVKNEALYELPEAGGLGIYWYTIGGMLFMMAAALILYKNKHGEVLKR